jgi:DNA-binding winged helix-turn-helix (wHTH) protein
MTSERTLHLATRPRVRRFRFGTFELDVELGELRQSGVKLPLHGQPLQVLELLLASPGELVSRDELRRALWPDGTIVEFDDSP